MSGRGRIVRMRVCLSHTPLYARANSGYYADDRVAARSVGRRTDLLIFLAPTPSRHARIRRFVLGWLATSSLSLSTTALRKVASEGCRYTRVDTEDLLEALGRVEHHSALDWDRLWTEWFVELPIETRS